MFKRYTEYRETQQLRKDHLAKQKMRYALIALLIMVPLFAVLAVVEASAPAEPVKTAPAVSPANQQETREIEEFAYIVTKPLDELTSEDIDLMGKHSKDPCYEKNALLPREQMIVAITKCKGAS